MLQHTYTWQLQCKNQHEAQKIAQLLEDLANELSLKIGIAQKNVVLLTKKTVHGCQGAITKSDREIINHVYYECLFVKAIFLVEMEGVAPSSDMAKLHKVFQTKYISNLRFSIDGSKFENHSNYRNTNYKQGQHISDPSRALIGYLRQKHAIKCNQHESGVTRLTLTTIKINHDYAACGTPSKIRLTRELAKSRSELN
jgi:hypothetical protein